MANEEKHSDSWPGGPHLKSPPYVSGVQSIRTGLLGLLTVSCIIRLFLNFSIGLTVFPLGAKQDFHRVEPKAGDSDSGCRRCSVHQHRWNPRGDVPGTSILSPGTGREASAGLTDAVSETALIRTLVKKGLECRECQVYISELVRLKEGGHGQEPMQS